MGCGWSLQDGSHYQYWFQSVPPLSEDEKQLEQVSQSIKEIDNMLLALRVRHDILYKRIREPGIPRKMQLLIFAHTKKNNGLQLALVNLKLSIEESAVMANVAHVLRHSRVTLLQLARKSKDIDIHKVIDEIKLLTDDMDDAQNSIMDLSEFNEDELEEELQEFLDEDKSVPKPILPQFSHYQTSSPRQQQKPKQAVLES